MKPGFAQIIEVRQPPGGERQAVIALKRHAYPAAGQYFQAFHPEDQAEAVGISLFPGGHSPEGLPQDCFTTASGIPAGWQPGDRLFLRGPLGRGFSLPPETSRLALAAFGPTCEHLLPLASEVMTRGGEVALFTNGGFDALPTRIEVNPLESLAEALAWADMLAGSIPLEACIAGCDELAALSSTLTPVQLLVYGQFACGALADCGVCAIRTPGGQQKLACKHGPVFDWGK